MNLYPIRRDNLAIWMILAFIVGILGLYVYSQTGSPELDIQYDLPGKSRARGIGHTWPVIVRKHDPETWTPPQVPEHLRSADQDNEELIQHIRDHWVIPPFPAGQLTVDDGEEKRVHFSQVGQSETVDTHLKGLSYGFFIECGAGDGQFLSNSLFFEKHRNWTGLLIEVDPLAFANIIKIRRHGYMMNACLSPSRKATVLNYTRANGYPEHDTNETQSREKRDLVDGSRLVQCFPLASILKAISVYRIDYFSLDVEGRELEILGSIPFNEFYFGALTIDFRAHGDEEQTHQKHRAIEQLMVDKHGYRKVEVINNVDILFVKN